MNSKIAHENQGEGRRMSNMNKLLEYFPSKESGKRPMSATIYKKQPNEVLALLTELKNLPQFMQCLADADYKDDMNQSTWYFKSMESGDLSVEMDLNVSEVGDGLIWKAKDMAGFMYSIAVQLEKAQAERGTVVRMMVSYDSQVGKVAGVLEKMFGGDAEILTKKTLQRLKAFCETGSVPTTEGQPSGRDEDNQNNLKH